MLGSSRVPWPTTRPRDRRFGGVNGRDIAAKSSEVNVFRSRFRAGLFVKERISGQALEFREHFKPRRAVGRSEPDVNAGRRSFRPDVVRTHGVGHRYNDQLTLSPCLDLDVGDQKRSDTLREGVGQPFLVHQRIGEADDIPGLVLHADDDHPARGVGEGDDGPNDAVKRPAVLLELQCLAFISGQELFHHLMPPS